MMTSLARCSNRGNSCILKCFMLLLLLVNSSVSDNFDDDIYESKEERILEASYHGLIKENETFVEITPLIKVDQSKVCDFHITKKGNHEIPFEIKLVNDLGVLKATKTLNCEKHKNYKFQIAAVYCDGSYSKSANVHISVIDINEYSPTFLQPSYVTEVDEGRFYKEIIRVEATDRDCTPLFGDVCKYEILSTSADHQPFTIDNEGIIRNTVLLSHKASQNHILSVVAYDCAMKQSAPVMVTIRVRRVCEAKMLDVPEYVNYTANSANGVFLFPKIQMELCDLKCHDNDLVIRSTINLQTDHISFGCDRDASKCLQQHNLIDLLPRGTSWTKDLVNDEGGSDSVFHFDGNTGAIVPATVVSTHDFALHPFSVVTIFRHHNSFSMDKHTKEHIVCSADDHKMNRHHMALFVRNCRLILLLRKNFNEGDLNIFSPAEWRWKIPQVCDNEWHHYTVNIDLPKVDLFIDGFKFEASTEDRHSNPEVIDDWPLHAAHGINTTLAIGACYQGSENRLKHAFNGDIAEIKLALQTTLTDNEIKCGTECAEHLVTPAEHILEPAQQVQSNTQLNEIVIEGKNQSNIEQLLQNVQYVNNRETPTIGRRNLEVKTTVSCPNKKAIRLPTIQSYIMVLENAAKEEHDDADNEIPHESETNHVHDENLQPNEQPQIIITGKQNRLVSYPDIKDGVHILANITINVYSGGKVQPQLQKLDTCSVTVFPSLNPDHEQITLETSGTATATLDIKTSISKDGVDMVGYDSIANYLAVLESLAYTNKKPAYYLNRVFKLSCSQMNMRFRSSEYTLTITVLHPKQSSTSAPVLEKESVPVQQVQSQELHDQVHESQQHEPNLFAHAMIHSHDIEEPSVQIHHNVMRKASNVTHSTLLIVVICIAFVAMVCGITFARLRNNSQGMEALPTTSDKHISGKISAEQQLDWDDSALTITINPMQNCGVSDESSDSENSESDDEEITTNGRYRNVSQLEWDNSTI